MGSRAWRQEYVGQEFGAQTVDGRMKGIAGGPVLKSARKISYAVDVQSLGVPGAAHTSAALYPAAWASASVAKHTSGFVSS